MDLDTLLHETAAAPAPGEPALAKGRTALAAATAESARRVAAARRRRPALRLALVATLAGAASLALVAGPTLRLGDSPPPATADAAQVLRRAGAAAGAQEGGWPDAAYWHSVSTYVRDGGRQERREIWIGRARPGVLVDSGLNGGTPLPIGVAHFPAGGTGLSWDELYALPTDPAELERVLRAGINGAGNGDDSELFVIVGDLLRESPAPPPLRQALWEVAARIPGIELLGPTTDAAGRAGVAVRRDTQLYVLDPEDGRLLEEASGRAEASAEAPRGSGWRATYLEQGPADRAP